MDISYCMKIKETNFYLKILNERAQPLRMFLSIFYDMKFYPKERMDFRSYRSDLPSLNVLESKENC